jgi:TolB-like protein
LNTPRPGAYEATLHILPLPVRPLLALRPFVASGPDPALRQLARDISARLRTGLEADPRLGPNLIHSELLSRALPHALDVLCHDLAVGHLISGKCHPTGDEPSLYVELTDMRDSHVRWAEFYRLGARSMLAEDGEALSGLVRALREALVEYRQR